jgi:hypothetical protein
VKQLKPPRPHCISKGWFVVRCQQVEIRCPPILHTCLQSFNTSQTTCPPTRLDTINPLLATPSTALDGIHFPRLGHCERRHPPLRNSDPRPRRITHDTHLCRRRRRRWFTCPELSVTHPSGGGFGAPAPTWGLRFEETVYGFYFFFFEALF